MSIRDIALNSYYYASMPLRWHLQNSLAADRRSPICVLFYHRIADSHPNDWSMSTGGFRRQIDWLQNHVELISLEEVQARMANGNSQVAASITFDDGYADNCEFAIPLLIQRQIPCTYFVSLDFILRQRAFPHDVDSGIPLPPNTLDQLRSMADAGIEIGAHTRTHCDLGQVHDPDVLADELIDATHELAERIGHPVRYFAFPYGLPQNLNRAAAELARASGIEAICSAYGAYCLPGDDPFHIRRIHGDPDFARLRNWLTVDPRKLSIGRDFEMQEVPLLEPVTS